MLSGPKFTFVFCVVLFISFLACMLGFQCLQSRAKPKITLIQFERQAWAEGSVEIRGYMVDSLLKGHNLKGMTKLEVVDLLGYPDDDQQSINRFRYHLGHMGRNPKWTFLTEFSLLIEFGTNGTVKSVTVAD